MVTLYFNHFTGKLKFITNIVSKDNKKKNGLRAKTTHYNIPIPEGRNPFNYFNEIWEFGLVVDGKTYMANNFITV